MFRRQMKLYAVGVLYYMDLKRSLIFWIWNDRLSAGEIRRQIREMRSRQIDGFFVHPMPEEFRRADFPGGMPGYLSDEFFAMVSVAAEEASANDMQLWLYDEGGWPSGTLNGFFRDNCPELMHRQIGIDGRITVNGFCPDLLDPRTTQIFLEKVHEKYRHHLGKYFGSVIPGIFTDEPFFGIFDPANTLPFSPVLEEEFLWEKSYSAREAAERIFKSRDPQACQDYCDVWLKLAGKNYLKVIADWCHRNNLLFAGHFNGDDVIDNLCKLAGADIFHLHSFFDVPGCDAIWRQIHPLALERDFSGLTASAAGDKLCISETFAVYGNSLSPAEMKQIAAMQFVSGIKIVAAMALHYSDRGGRQITTVSGLGGEGDVRWENYRSFASFCRRMSQVFNRTTPVIKGVIPFPVSALQRQESKGENIFADALLLAEKQITYTFQRNGEVSPEKSAKPDIESDVPCPALRTRHLISPRGERRIFVNAGLSDLTVKFSAPDGYNCWYDPADGSHFPAFPDGEGKISLTLPFAGVMILLTVPGKCRRKAVPESLERSRIALNFQFDRAVREVKATAEGLKTVPFPTEIKENFCGTLRYKADVSLPESCKAFLILPGAKKSICKISVNGRELSTSVWAPYRWEVVLDKGENRIELDISDTPDKAFTAPEHLAYLQENGFDNTYFQRTLEFPVLFPDEDPLAEAYLSVR